MKLLVLLPILSATSAISVVRRDTAAVCKIVGSGNGQCRTCPASVCNIKYGITTGTTISVMCGWNQGEVYNGDSHWAYLNAYNCFVWAPRTDCNMAAIGECQLIVGTGTTPPVPPPTATPTPGEGMPIWVREYNG
ncbi:hypothetical protein BGZ60DRAFT_568142 [Tricladium varicosporioides]|nr:hypothetical protein BGZ60DRAFT_568142 [Hymenoscyphus varicosporioides]